MKTAILMTVMLSLAYAQSIQRSRPFQRNPNQQQAFQPRQLEPQQQQQQQQQHHNQPQLDASNDNAQYQEAPLPSSSSSGRGSERHTTTFIPILKWDKEQEHDGTYRASYETGNNIIAEESGYIKTVGVGEDAAEALVQQGSFTYTSPEGHVITTHYKADETGFHVSGDHLPTSPPVSDEIQKGLDLIYAGIRQQQEAAEREAASKNNQPINQQIDRRAEAEKFRS